MILSGTFAIWLLGVLPPTKRGPPTKSLIFFAPGLPPVKSGPDYNNYNNNNNMFQQNPTINGWVIDIRQIFPARFFSARAMFCRIILRVDMTEPHEIWTDTGPPPGSPCMFYFSDLFLRFEAKMRQSGLPSENGVYGGQILDFITHVKLSRGEWKIWINSFSCQAYEPAFDIRLWQPTGRSESRCYNRS